MLRSYVTGNAELFVFDVGHLLDLRSFPTRRSSDLHDAVRAGYRRGGCAAREEGIVPGRRAQGHRHLSAESERRGRQGGERSEEHTPELQSLTNLVCRLLLENKKHRTDTYAETVERA